MKTRRFARSQALREVGEEAPTGTGSIAVLPRLRRPRGRGQRVIWTRSKVALVVATSLLIVAVAYLAYLTLRTDLNRPNVELNQRVQVQSVEIARLQTKSADLETKLAAATTDLGIVRSKLQLQRATLRVTQARGHLVSGDSAQALKALNDASLALDAAGSIASADAKTQITAALRLVQEAEGAVRSQQPAVPQLERLGDQLAVLTAD